MLVVYQEREVFGEVIGADYRMVITFLTGQENSSEPKGPTS